MSQRTARTAVTLTAVAGVLFAGLGAPASAAPPATTSSTDTPPSLPRAVAAADRAVASGLDGLVRSPQEAYQRERVTPWIKDLYSVAYERTYRGLPVVGGDAVVLVDGAGAVQATQTASKIKLSVSVTAKVSAGQAERLARTRLTVVDKVTSPRWLSGSPCRRRTWRGRPC